MGRAPLLAAGRKLNKNGETIPSREFLTITTLSLEVGLTSVKGLDRGHTQ